MAQSGRGLLRRRAALKDPLSKSRGRPGRGNRMRQ